MTAVCMRRSYRAGDDIPDVLVMQKNEENMRVTQHSFCFLHYGIMVCKDANGMNATEDMFDAAVEDQLWIAIRSVRLNRSACSNCEGASKVLSRHMLSATASEGTRAESGCWRGHLFLHVRCAASWPSV
jgi:hypothetical protein